jgi:hypothetical protein
VGALLACAPARAGNDDESFVGNQAAMAGGAVAASVADASATWYNPAGLASVAQTHIDVSGTAYTLRFYSASALLRSTSGEGAGFSVTEFVSIPSQLAYARQLGKGLTLGLGYFVPQASNLLLRDSLRVDSGGARSEWQLAVGATRVTHSFGAALGLALSPRARLGFGLIGTYEVQTSSTSIVASARQGEQQSAFALSSNLGNFSRLGLEPSVGFQLELSRRLTLALTARGPRALLFQSTHYSLAVGAADASSGVVGAEIAEPKQGTTGLHALRAGRLGAGLAFRPWPALWLGIEADVQPAIYNAKAGVDRRSVVNARLGGVYQLSDVVALGAGLFSDRSPDHLTKDALNGTGDFYGGTFGLELGDRHRLHPDERSDALLLSTTIALKYAYSKGTFNSLVVDPAAIDSLGSAPATLVAHETSLYVGGGVSF